MSREDEYIIIGRLTDERAEVRRKSAFIDEELRHLAAGFMDMMGMMNRRLVHGPDPCPIEEFPAVVVKYAELSKLRALF